MRAYAGGTPTRLALLLLVLCCVAVSSATAAAQEAGEEANEGEKQAPAQKSRLVWFLESSGTIGAVILLLSVYFIATVSRLFFEMRPQISTPPELLSQCQSLLEKRDFKGIYTLVQGDESDFAQIVTAGLTELSGGLSDARDAMERVSDVITTGMEKKISMLAVLGTLGPMIGLLGTLKGMISSFSVIALSDTQLKASEVAGGISEALLLTFEGVALSVPAIYFFAVFKNRVATISATTFLQADDFVRRLSLAVRSKSGSPAAAPAGRTP